MTMNGRRPMDDTDFKERLRAGLQWLAVPRHARWDELALLTLRSRVLERLEAYGPVEPHHFQEGSDSGVNLILRLPGQRPELEPPLVGAHVDGPLGSPGADDNPTGVAALLELARRLSALPTRRPLWLVAFDLQEWGRLGSRALARELRRDQQRLHLMLSLGHSVGKHVTTKVLPVLDVGRHLAAPDVDHQIEGQRSQGQRHDRGSRSTISDRRDRWTGGSTLSVVMSVVSTQQLP